jgi:hypothetical protein
MSFQAVTWAIQQRAGSPSAKATLWSIANYANDQLVTWMSQKLIAEESEQSPDSVQRRIVELIDMGLVRRIPLHYAGRRSIDFFVLANSPWFASPLAEVEALIPRTHVIAPGFSDDDTLPQTAAATNLPLPQTLPQFAVDATALVRQQEPLATEPKIERDARERAIDRPVFEELPEPVLLDRIRKAHPQAAHADQDDVEAAWRALDVEERAAAARLIEAWLATKVGRHPLGLAKYLRQKLWTLLPEAQPPKATERTSLRAFTSEWWAVWLERVEAGETVRFMSDEALSNRDWIIPGPTPSKMVVDRLVPIPLNSLEHRAWTDHLAKVGVRLPRPLGAGAVWMPTKTPTPGFGAVKQKQVA